MDKEEISNEKQPQNKMAYKKISHLIWQMGLPMIISMVLQALYNVVDTMFVINMGNDGTAGNLALTAAFPVQILMIAIGVGTGVGLNALLSKSLGEGNKEYASKVAGNGLFLSAIFYLVFLIFGLFISEPYMKLMSNDAKVIEMGTAYLIICCCLSFGSIGYAVVERFLMSTGKTTLSMICQVSGAVANIVLDYVFIYPLGMGIAGAAYATIIGQILSLVMGLLIHIFMNKEISANPKYMKPSWKVIKSIYKIGLPAFLMQAMLSIMMFVVLLIIGTISNSYDSALLSGSYGIYYKLMQIALFACFGMSNCLISIVSFNYGMGDKERIKESIKWGLIDSVIVALAITVIYEALAPYISELFALTVDESSNISKDDIISTCVMALRICSIGYAFMGFSVGAQGILQGFNKVYSPLLISFLRLIALPLPLAYLFTLASNPVDIIWWAFPIAEIATAIITMFILWDASKKTIKNLK